MPTYEYRCKDCNHGFDVVQSFTDAALTECPSCAGSLRKVFGNVGITFKGSGFYKTDSRSGSNGSKADKKSDGDSTSKSDSSSESKPAAAKDSKDSKAGSKEKSSKRDSSSPKPAPASA